MINYTAFTNEIALYVPMCPSPLIQQATKEAVISFATLSEAFVEKLEITLVPGQAVYDLTVSDGMIPIRIRDGHVANRGKLEPTSLAMLIAEYNVERTGSPTAYYQEQPNQVKFYPSPLAEEIVTLYVVTKPSRVANGLRDDLAETHWETIMNGSISRLASMRNSDWFDPELAAQRGMAFNTGIELARRLALNIDKNKQRTVRYGGY